MKLNFNSKLLVPIVTILIAGTAAAFGQGAAAPAAPGAAAPAGGGRGGGGGGGAVGTPGLALPLQPYQLLVGIRGNNTNSLTDLELTSITRAEESFQKEIDAANAARALVASATFAQPLNAADLNAKLQALADSELQNALKQSDAYAKLLVEFKDVPAGRIQTMRSALGTAGTGGAGGRGGGGGGAPRGAAPAAPGGAAPGAAPAAPRGGN